MLNIAVWQGDAAPPFEPPALRAAADAAGGRGVPRTRRRCAPLGPPHRHGYRPRQRPAEHAAYEVAAAVDGADANVDRVRHGYWARAEPPSRARSATIGTSPPLGKHAHRSGARASLGDRRGGVPRQPLPGTREAWPQRVPKGRLAAACCGLRGRSDPRTHSLLGSPRSSWAASPSRLSRAS